MSASASVARAQEALRMGWRERVVQHARLAPAREEDAPALRFALEDALNTVDFADCGRLIVVRRLLLSAVPPRAGPTLLARALQNAWRALAMRAVSYDHPQAASADAVYFGSRWQARLAWLAAFASGTGLQAWYWQTALPELKDLAAAHSKAQALEQLVETLLQESTLDTLAALRSWPDAVLAQLARRLPDATTQRLLAAAVSHHSARVAAAPDQRTWTTPMATLTALRAHWATVAQRLLAQMPLDESAGALVAALWLASAQVDRPTLDEVRSLIANADTLSTAKHDSPEASGGAASMITVRSSLAFAVPSGADAGDAVRRADAMRAPLPRSPDAVSTPNGVTARSIRRVEVDLPTLASARSLPARGVALSRLPWLTDGALTRQGGLLFAIRLLQVLGFERWLAQQAAPLRRPFAHAWFAHTLRVHAARLDDPQHAWFEPTAAEQELLAHARFVEASQFLDARQALRLWRARAGRALRRQAGLTLPQLADRQAWASSSATHIDLVFAQDQVDLRIRRLGLDSDPGWVPWLGRIVSFHFVAADCLPAAFTLEPPDG
jgi:hypothetical protein